jgi:transcriptional regulator with XRE-family HTH domain
MAQKPPDRGMMGALATSLRNWRIGEGLSQVEAAERLGISYGSYQLYEEARALPRPGRMREISRVTEIPIPVLLAHPDELAVWLAALRQAENEGN